MPEYSAKANGSHYLSFTVPNSHIIRRYTPQGISQTACCTSRWDKRIKGYHSQYFAKGTVLREHIFAKAVAISRNFSRYHTMLKEGNTVISGVSYQSVSAKSLLVGQNLLEHVDGEKHLSGCTLTQRVNHHQLVTDHHHEEGKVAMHFADLSVRQGDFSYQSANLHHLGATERLIIHP